MFVCIKNDLFGHLVPFDDPFISISIRDLTENIELNTLMGCSGIYDVETGDIYLDLRDGLAYTLTFTNPEDADNEVPLMLVTTKQGLSLLLTEPSPEAINKPETWSTGFECRMVMTTEQLDLSDWLGQHNGKVINYAVNGCIDPLQIFRKIRAQDPEAVTDYSLAAELAETSSSSTKQLKGKPMTNEIDLQDSQQTYAEWKAKAIGETENKTDPEKFVVSERNTEAIGKLMRDGNSEVIEKHHEQYKNTDHGQDLDDFNLFEQGRGKDANVTHADEASFGNRQHKPARVEKRLREDAELNAIADERAGQKRIRVDIDDL